MQFTFISWYFVILVILGNSAIVIPQGCSFSSCFLNVKVKPDRNVYRLG